MLNNIPMYEKSRKFFDRNQNIIQTIFNMELEIINENHYDYFLNLNDTINMNLRQTPRTKKKSNTNNLKKTKKIINMTDIIQKWASLNRGRNIYPVDVDFCEDKKKTKKKALLSLFNSSKDHPNPLCVGNDMIKQSCNKYPNYPDIAYKFYFEKLFTKFETIEDLLPFLKQNNIFEKKKTLLNDNWGRREGRVWGSKRLLGGRRKKKKKKTKQKKRGANKIFDTQKLLSNQTLLVEFYKKYVNSQLKLKVLMFFYLNKLLFQTDTPNNKDELKKYMPKGIFKLILGKYITKSEIIQKINLLKPDHKNSQDYSFIINFKDIFDNINKILNSSLTITDFFNNLSLIEIYKKQEILDQYLHSPVSRTISLNENSGKMIGYTNSDRHNVIKTKSLRHTLSEGNADLYTRTQSVPKRELSLTRESPPNANNNNSSFSSIYQNSESKLNV